MALMNHFEALFYFKDSEPDLGLQKFNSWYNSKSLRVCDAVGLEEKQAHSITDHPPYLPARTRCFPEQSSSLDVFLSQS